MSITFERIINLTEPTKVGSLMIANEPNNNINQFYIVDNKTQSREANIVNADYDSLIWKLPYVPLTSRSVSKIGIKSFPQVGAMAFYSLLDEERSFVVCPVFIDRKQFTKPGFSAVVNENGTVTFTMTQPSTVSYECYRIVMRRGTEAFEYVTYDETLTVDPPYTAGDYDCHCIGYVGEGQITSVDSDYVTLTISTTGPDPRPESFVTQEQLAAALQVALADYATDTDLTTAIQAAILDAWEASY